jgi:hypothetical protein
MKFDDFIKKYTNKPIDFDGAWGNQCVDLYRMYVQEVLGFPQSPSVTGAADIWTSYLPEYYDKVSNTPNGVPQKGDVVIWNKKAGGGYGHVAIFIEGSVDKFTSFDQNYPTGSYCHQQEHTYTNVYGWLRPKQQTEDCQTKLAWYEAEYPKEQQRVIDARKERDEIKNSYDGLTTEYSRLKEDSRIQIESAEAVSDAQKQKYQDLIRELASRLGTTQDEATILPSLDTLIEIEGQLSAVRKELDQNQKTLTAKDQTIKDMRAEIDRLKEEARKAKGLGDATTADLINEIIKRLTAIIRR